MYSARKRAHKTDKEMRTAAFIFTQTFYIRPVPAALIGEVLLKGMSRKKSPLRLGADTLLSRHSAQLFERVLSIREWSSSGRVAYFVSAREAQVRFLFPVVSYPCCSGAIRF